ncbi:NAD-dependent epimerase/dehydratase family protein [uncultured Thermanaerothrix sp.]|uniref:NAD-dependent epimerase/dehydratase family protein n=1 Tax=uncultured Thermanaerothrix sp. TaxID=1195149 RepID=UPI0026366AA4|nr:NAD-dependent epimerase/dehydratase family protein [uncultured Thermanaerothrix sp.]
MRVLVTGASGFIGGHLCRELIARGHAVRAFHRPTSSLRLLMDLPVEHALGDLTRPESVEAALEGVEVVFHTAALLGDRANPAQHYAVTVEGTRTLLMAALRAGVQRVVHTSSAVALGIPIGPLQANEDPHLYLIDETHTWNYPPERWPYAYAKYLAEMEVQRAVALGLDAVVVNPTLVLGPGDHYRRTRSIVVQVARRRLPFLTSGGLNAVHVADVIQGHLLALERGRRGERYLLGGENLTLRALVTAIAAVCGVPMPTLEWPARLIRALSLPLSMLEAYVNLPIEARTLALAGYYFYYSHAKAQTELGYTPQHTVEAAIRDTWAWLQGEI